MRLNVREYELLTDMLYLEARGENVHAQIAVLSSVWCRFNSPRWWGSSIEEIIKMPHQYAYTLPMNFDMKTWMQLSDITHYSFQTELFYPRITHFHSLYDLPKGWEPLEYRFKIGRINFLYES